MNDLLQTLNRENIIIRPVEENDRDAINAIAAQIWDGHDYLPHVFDSWLNDNQGTFDAMVLNDRLVGISKLSRISEREWWLEGLRIDPQYQGQGLARIFHHFKVNQARQIGNGVLRFSTASENEAIHKLAKETGFQIQTVFAIFKMESTDIRHDQFWQLTSNDLSRVMFWLENSDYFEQVDHSFEHGWKWHRATTEHVQHLLGNGQVYGWNLLGAKDTVQGILVVHDSHEEKNGDRILRIAYGDASDEQRYDFWSKARGLAQSLGATHVEVKVADDVSFSMPFISQGWIRRDLDVFLYTRPLNLTEESAVQYTTMPVLE